MTVILQSPYSKSEYLGLSGALFDTNLPTLYYFILMKKRLIALTATLLFASFANAQDIIQLKSGKTEEVQILEINKEKVKFKKFNNKNGPTYSVKLEKVATIKYESGMTMNLGAVEQPAPAPVAPAAEPVTQPAPEPVAEPVAAPMAEPQAAAVPDSTQQPAQEPPAQQESGFVPEPAPQQETAFVQEPAPQPEPETVVEPEPAPAPVVAPEPESSAPVVAAAEDEYESGEAAPKEETKPEAAEATNDSTGKKPYKTVGLTILTGLNVITDVDVGSNSQSAELDFFCPVTLMELDFMLSGNFALLFGTGFMYASTSDSEIGWLGMNQRYDSDLFGNLFFMPLYGGLKLHLGGTDRIHPYGKVNLGYTFMWADDPILDPIGSSYWGYYSMEESYAYGGFTWGFAFGIENPVGIVLEAGVTMFSGGIYSEYRYNGSRWVTDSEMDFMFVNIKFGIRF